MPDRCRIETQIQFDKDTRGCGIMLHASDDYESAYYIRLEPTRNRLVFDTWPRPGDIPFMVELERPIGLQPGTPVSLTVLVDRTVCVVYANDKVAMNTRMCNLTKGSWGVFVEQGVADFKETHAFL
jgi:beta-fructofuranosidase